MAEEPTIPDRFEIVTEDGAPAPRNPEAYAGEARGVSSAAQPIEPAGPRREPLPQLCEAVMMLVMLGLVVWTCWVLYAPQIARMLQLMAGKP